MGFLSLLLSFVLYIQDSVAMVFYWKICRTHRLSLEEFVPWLERRLLDASIYELIGLNRCLYLIEVRIAKVKEYSHEYRSSASTITTPLATRIQKVCDHIENINGVALNRLELEKVMSSNGAQPLTFLPDRTQLYDFIHRLKDKLKAIDELASSKKTDNSKAKNAKFASSNRSESKKAQELNAIKAELKKLATLLEELRVIIEDKRVILDYYGSMKLNVHVPLNDIFYRISTLPSIDDAKAIAQISFHDLKRCEDQYNSARVSDGLVTIAQLNSEIEFIEMEISSLTKPLADTLSISKTSRTKEEPIRSEGVAETPPEQHLDAEVRDAIANGDVTDAFSKILQLTSSMGQFSRGDR